jgi:dTDP-4-amino-4,6-dideoxygalactose transaminase
VATPWQHPDGYSARHLYVIRLHLARLRTTHRRVFESLRASGIGVNLHYIPVYRHPYYARRGHAPASYPEAERYYADAISLPIFPALTDAQQQRVIDAVTSAVAG